MKITSNSDLQAALTRLEAIADAEPDTPEAVEFETLSALVSAYEDERYPMDHVCVWVGALLRDEEMRQQSDEQVKEKLRAGVLPDVIIESYLRTRSAFYAWESERVVHDPKILAGSATFRGTRLGVRQVGEMIFDRRERAVAELREDYPYLTDEDFRFAPIWLNYHVSDR